MTEESTMQSVKNAGIVGELEIIVFGVVVMLFSAWLFGGFGYWQLPGLVILFIGLSELINKFYKTKTDRADLRVGLLVTFIGLAGYLSFVLHVVFGGPQIISVAIIVLGLLLLVKGILAAR